MKNPFILNKLSQGILQKKPSAEKAIIKQDLRSALLPGYNYRLAAQGRAKFSFVEDEEVVWSSGDVSSSIILEDSEVFFVPSSKIIQFKLEMLDHEDELFSVSIQEAPIKDGEEGIIEYEFITNNHFMDRRERYISAEGITPIEERGTKLRWIEGYNSYIVREVS